MPAVVVKGLKEFRTALAALDKQWVGELRRANLQAAQVVAVEAQSEAQGMGSVQAKAAPAIKAAGEQTRSKINVQGGGAYPYALGAFYGAKRFKQFPPWVGNTWEPGGPGGPYAINPAIRSTETEWTDVFAQLIDRIARAAFPD